MKMNALRFNIDNEVSFMIEPLNGDMIVEVDHKKITVSAQLAQELIAMLQTKQYEVFEKQKENWLKKLFSA
jgi:hypothetical protein